MFHRTVKRWLGHDNPLRRNVSQFGRRLLLEPLEDRRLLSLVGVLPTFPVVSYDSTGTLSYNAAALSLAYTLDAQPLTFKESATAPSINIIPTRDLAINITVDHSGKLIGGVAGDDLTVVGTIDTNGNGVVDAGEYTGTLLTGEISQFGFLNVPGTTDRYDFRFTPTGGALLPLFAGKDIGVTTTSENSTLINFNSNFQGKAKGSLGSIDTGIQLVKLTNGTNNNNPTGPLVPVGSTVSWTYQVTNKTTNSVALANVSVTDSQGVTPIYQSGDTNGNHLLEKTETWIYMATGAATAGQYTNVGMASGTDSTAIASSPMNSSDVDHYFGVQPGIAVLKSTNGTHNPNVVAGSTVTWTYDLTNTGNVALADILVSDSPGVVLSGPSGDTNNNGLLDLSEMWTYTATGTAIVGAYANTATVQGSDATATVLAPVSATASDGYFGVQPGIAVLKFTNSTSNPYVAAGSTVTWTYNLINTGNVALAGVSVSDNQGVVLSGPSGDTNSNGLLDLSEMWTYTASGTAIAGAYTNTATVQASDVTATVLAPVSATVSDGYFGVQPGIAVVKSTNGTHNPNVAAGSTVTWTYDLTNTGNVALAGVSVSDNQGVVLSGPSGDTNSNGLLDLGEMWSYTASGTAIVGAYANTATVQASDATATVLAPVSATVSDGYFGMAPGIAVVKSTNGTHNPNVAAGSTVTWTYDLTNTGNVALAGVSVSDSQGVVLSGPSGDTNNNGLLDLGEMWSYTASGTAIVGAYANTATATGTDVLGDSATANASDGYFGVAPGIAVLKLTNGTDNNAPTGPVLTVGSAVAWTYQATNMGNVALADVTVSESDPSVLPVYQSGDNGNNLLDPGETWVFAAAGTAVEGQYANTATVTGTDATGTVETAVQASDVDYYFGQLLPSSLSGFVYNDANDNGAYEPNLGESGIAGAVLSLSGTDDLGHAVSLSTVTGADGRYVFDNLRPGTYAVAEAQPADYLDGTDVIGTQGGQVSNDLLHDIVLAQGVNGTDNNFGELLPAKLSGFVWLDANDNGELDLNEMAIANVKLTLTGTDDRGNSVNATAVTEVNGYYDFANLRPGTYTITETQPAGYADGKDSIGTQGGVVGNDQFSNIALTPGTIGINNNFGERPTTAVQLSTGMTATIGFWHNKNGQALINSLNGSSNSTALGNWLAASFPNMYGATAGANALAGKSNAYVASYFLQLFSAKGQKLEAQVLAVAFATYVTDSDLAGGIMARGYGFIVNTAGTGIATYNVGANGAAFGVANNTILSIMDILNRINERSRKGVLWDMDGNSVLSSAEQVLRNMGNVVCTGINETGDIG